MDDELLKKFEVQDQKLDAIYKIVRSMRRSSRLTLIITILVIVVPLIGLSFAIPAFLKSFDLTALGL